MEFGKKEYVASEGAPSAAKQTNQMVASCCMERM